MVLILIYMITINAREFFDYLLTKNSKTNIGDVIANSNIYYIEKLLSLGYKVSLNKKVSFYLTNFDFDKFILLFPHMDDKIYHVLRASRNLTIENIKHLQNLGFTLSSDKISIKNIVNEEILYHLSRTDDNFISFVKVNFNHLSRNVDDKCKQFLSSFL